jgi:hypothetical protein
VSYLADDLVLAVQELATLPENDERFTSTKILSLADTETLGKVIPLVKRHVAAYLSYDKDYALSSTGSYRVPPRAVMGALLDVKLVSGDQEEPVNIIDEHQVRNRTLSHTPGFSCFLKNNTIITLPRSISGWTTIRMTYMLRPSQLVLASAAAQVTAINTGTNTVTCSSVPTTFSASTPLDVIRANAQAEILAIDQTPSSVVTGASGTIQLSSLPSSLEVGDYLALAGQSPVVLLPREVIPYLEQLVANRCLQSQTDKGALQEGLTNAKELRDGITILITPRVQHQPKVLVPNHGLTRRRG